MTIFLSLLLSFSLNLCASSDVKEQASDQEIMVGKAELTPESAFRQISPEDYEQARKKQVSPTPFSSPLGPQPHALGAEHRRHVEAISHLDINQARVDQLLGDRTDSGNIPRIKSGSHYYLYLGGATLGILYTAYKSSNTVQERTHKSLKRARNLLKKFWKKRQETTVTTGFVLKSGIALGLLYYLSR